MALRYRQKESSQQEASERRTDNALDVMLWVRDILNVDEDIVVSVSGHQCGDAACAGAETIILLARPGQATQAIRIAKSLATVTQADVAEALELTLSPVRVIRVR